MWDISKHEDVRISNWWRGSVWRSERETAMVALTRTNAHEVPHQTFDFDFYADDQAAAAGPPRPLDGGGRGGVVVVRWRRASGL